MADYIVVDHEACATCVAEYKRALESLEECTNTYQNALDALEIDYRGVAYAAMSVKVAAMLNNIRSSFNNIQDAIAELEEVTQISTDVENKMKSTAAALDKGEASPFQG